MTTLTEDERDDFCICPYAHDTADDAENAALVAGCDRYLNDVIAPLAARLASVKALADEWDGLLHERGPDVPPPTVTRCVDALRAVLGSDAHTEQKGAEA